VIGVDKSQYNSQSYYCLRDKQNVRECNSCFSPSLPHYDLPPIVIPPFKSLLQSVQPQVLEVYSPKHYEDVHDYIPSSIAQSIP